MTAAAGVQVTPAAAAFAVVKEPADADPREFLVDIRADDRSQPLDLRVTYYACDDANTFCVPVTQRYVVHLDVDPSAVACLPPTAQVSVETGSVAGVVAALAPWSIG